MDLHLRPARAEDCALLLEWRNDPVTRQGSLARGPVTPPEHQAWFQASLANPRRRLLIAEWEGRPVGVLRLDHDLDACELSWTVAPEARGQGVGKRMVGLGVQLAQRPVRARIRADNPASLGIARHCGLEQRGEENGVTHWASPERRRPRALAIVQARMESSRLPGKIMADIEGRPALHWVLSRLARSRYLDGVLVATSDHAADEAVESWCRQNGWDCLRGPHDDVLARFHQAAHQADADPIVRISADSPLIDPLIVDQALTTWWASWPRPDYLSNMLAPRFPLGLAVEVFTRAALDRCMAADSNPATREHVTPYLYQHRDQFHCLGIENPRDLSFHRWTLDTPEDLELLRRIFSAFGHGDFAWTEVLSLLDHHPDWVELNQHVVQRNPG